MSVLIETSLGDIVIDLYTSKCPFASENFLKLCKLKYYNNCLFYSVERDYLAQTGDPTNTGSGGTSVWGVLEGDKAKFFKDESLSKNDQGRKGLVGMASRGPNMNASCFFITLGETDEKMLRSHTIFGQIAEGMDVLDKLNKAYVDLKSRPVQNIRIKHTIIIDDPYKEPSRSPTPTNKTKADDYLEDDIDIEAVAASKTDQQLQEEIKDHQTKTRAAVLEILEDLPDADVEPPDNVLFVCKMNPVT